MAEIVKAITDTTFATEVLAQPLPVLVDYWAEWCGPCRMLSPLLEKIAAERAGRIVVVKVNVDENPETTARYSVMSLPAIHILSRGQVVKRIVGFKPKSVLLKEIDDVLRAHNSGETVHVPGQG